MSPDIRALKAAMRSEVSAKVAKLSDLDRADLASKACALLENQTSWQKAGFVLLYAPLPDELDIWALVKSGLASGKIISLPRFDSGRQEYVACRIKELAADLEYGRYGIQEPRSHCEAEALNRLDFVLVPGVAFDLHGRRLGRGKGYYDRILAQVRGETCGIAFDEQIVREVPVDPHDSDVNCILTPTRWIEL